MEHSWISYDNEAGDQSEPYHHLLRRQINSTEYALTRKHEKCHPYSRKFCRVVYFKYLVRAFAYLDLVFQDTPINDQRVETQAINN